MSVSCSSPVQGGDGLPSTTSPAPAPADISTGDLSRPDVREVEMGGRTLLVAWADSVEERRRGLMEVEDLGELDGMIFEFESERSVAFTMRNTLIPLDIYFFDSQGREVGRSEMVPCEAEPCPSYPSDEPVRYALEVPAGSLPVDDIRRMTVP